MNTPKDTDHLDSGKQVTDKTIHSDEQLHQKEAGNDREEGAEKDKLSGPQIDLVAQPGNDDNEAE
jgi:hypothetical protein